LNSHYFIPDATLQSRPQTFSYEFNGRTFKFTTDVGVFSVGKMDGQTDLLLRNMPPVEGSLLDMGCGYGCIGIALAGAHGLTLTQADVNPRAVELTKKNCAENGVASTVVLSDGFENISGSFHNIVINPPIHAGKQTVYRIYEGAFEHLCPNGNLFVVVHKKHGAESTVCKLDEIFKNCETFYKKKGCFLLRCKKL
jgi:16S rRNA (guanine1207-N2)-methyltransferase